MPGASEESDRRCSLRDIDEVAPFGRKKEKVFDAARISPLPQERSGGFDRQSFAARTVENKDAVAHGLDPLQKIRRTHARDPLGHLDAEFAHDGGAVACQQLRSSLKDPILGTLNIHLDHVDAWQRHLVKRQCRHNRPMSLGNRNALVDEPAIGADMGGKIGSSPAVGDRYRQERDVRSAIVLRSQKDQTTILGIRFECVHLAGWPRQGGKHQRMETDIGPDIANH
jgi:hypothetical protein